MLKVNPELKIVSRDEIRFSLLSENDAYFAKEREVFKEFIYQIIKYLNKGYDVVADATHVSVASRAKLLKELSLDDTTEVICIVMQTPLEECIKRNETRKGTKTYVPIDQLRRMYFSFEDPKENECDVVFYILPNGQTKMIEFGNVIPMKGVILL